MTCAADPARPCRFRCTFRVPILTNGSGTPVGATVDSVSTGADDQETTHQRAAIDDWLDEYEVDAGAVDHYADLGHSGSDPGREQFCELIDVIETAQYETVVVWEISQLARLGSIYQRFFERCEDAGMTMVITDGWVEEVRPDGTEKLIADISAAVVEEERRRLIKRVEAGWLGLRIKASGLALFHSDSSEMTMATSRCSSILIGALVKSAILTFGGRSNGLMTGGAIEVWLAMFQTLRVRHSWVITRSTSRQAATSVSSSPCSPLQRVRPPSGEPPRDSPSLGEKGASTLHFR